RDVVRGVVQVIADYGNALGVPNLWGDVVFDAAFDLNCLVNVMAVGIAPASGILRSRVPEGAGPWVFVAVGKPTDESGFGGAAFASGEFGEGDQRGAVQLPDPFLKRVLHVANAEAFRRVRERGIRAGFKDLGAGGVACATSELAAAGGRGAEIALERLHRVDRALPPEVLLCAETQERFCWVVPESFADELCDIYNREFALADVVPGAGARAIGVALEEPRYRVTWNGETLVDCPVEAITTGRRVPRPARRSTPSPAWRKPRGQRSREPRGALLRLLHSWHLCSREYLFRHYDGEVQGRAWLRSGEGDAAVIRARSGRALGLAFAVGGNPFWCAADPDLGAQHAVAEAARNVACVGARPWALTDCLNFGAPGDAGVMGDFESTIDGLARAARSLGSLAAPGHALPFVSGNVSLYNQSGDRAVPPSPIVMCAGVLDSVASATGSAVQQGGDFLVMVGAERIGLTGSSYVREVLGQDAGAPPELDLEMEAALQDLAVRAAQGRWVRAAHDVSDGGLAIALAEMAIGAPIPLGLGIDVDLGALGSGASEVLFCERPAIVFEVGPERAARLFQAARERSLPAWPIGTVSARPELRGLLPGRSTVEWTVESLRAAAASPLSKLWNEELS
ncbi:MAG: phosphoribosylformylglycinamidine synthase, partial [Candidatus Eisenbacteria bacterium]|nr:phosphoribosylformylglycinamidine synthase [Candidatus Eisenbacteria bacterium]